MNEWSKSEVGNEETGKPYRRLEYYPSAAKNSSLQAQQPESRRFNIPEQQSFDSEEMQGSLQQILADNINEYVVVEFLIGTERIMRKQGILYTVGRSYITLFDDVANDYIVCDIFSVKFVYFYYPGQRPNRNYNVLPSSNGNIR